MKITKRLLRAPFGAIIAAQVACGGDSLEREIVDVPEPLFHVERVDHAEFQLAAKEPHDALSYTWEFSDGTRLYGPKVNHRFTDEGSFSAQMTVSNAIGEAADSGRTLHVRNTAPVPKFGARYDGLTVTLIGSDSYDIDNNLSDYFWTVNDDNHYGEIVEVTLDQPGQIEVSLQVMDDFGVLDEDVIAHQILTVTGDENSPPRAAIDTIVEKNYLRLLGANSSDDDYDYLTYQWLISDGSEYQGEYVVHTFNTEGVYDITLIVDDGLATDQTTTQITVTEMDDPSKPYREALFEARLDLLRRCHYCHRNHEPRLPDYTDYEAIESELMNIALTRSPSHLYNFPSEQNGRIHFGTIGSRTFRAGDKVTDQLDVWHELVSGIAEYLGLEADFLDQH